MERPKICTFLLLFLVINTQSLEAQATLRKTLHTHKINRNYYGPPFSRLHDYRYVQFSVWGFESNFWQSALLRSFFLVILCDVSLGQ